MKDITYLKRREDLAVERVQYLRANATINERVFKNHLIEAKVPFVFQKAFVTYSWFFIVDFFIPSLGIVIELNGRQHYEKDALERDRKRVEWLKTKGIQSIHLTNTEALSLSISDIRSLLGMVKLKEKKKLKKEIKNTRILDFGP